MSDTSAAVPSPRALELAQTLVRMNTVSANGNLELIHFVRDELGKLGVRLRLAYDAGRTRANLFATLGEGKSAGYEFRDLPTGDAHAMQEGLLAGANVSELTGQKLTDMGRGPVFDDGLLDVQPA